MKLHNGGRGITLSIHILGTTRGGVDQRHASAGLPPGKTPGTHGKTVILGLANKYTFQFLLNFALFLDRNGQ